MWKDLQVIFEDNHLIAVNKPAGMLVHADRTGDTALNEYVKEYIKLQYDKPGAVFLGTIHRIDRPVSGVVVFARTSKALSRMQAIFRERKIEKTYWAVTAQRPDPLEDHLVHYLVKDRIKNKAKAYDQLSRRAAKAKKSELDYKLIGSLGDSHLLEVKPLTGRPHQIRVQLAKVGLPIRGDLKYGYPRSNSDGSIHLHCRRLSFVHPVRKEPVVIEALPPDEVTWNYFENIEDQLF